MTPYKNLFAALLMLVSGFTLAQSQKSEYKYRVDLTKVVNDRVYVELSTPKITTNEINYYLPKIIPGTYKIADYGRFIAELKAFDKSGKELPVERLETNGWKIKDAQKMTKLAYWVDDILDTTDEGPRVYPMAATNIEDGKNFVINTSGFFGYFENTKNVPFNFDVIRNKEMYGGTGLIPIQSDVPLTVLKMEKSPENNEKRVDRYRVENYDRLIDSPLMYAKADTAVIQVANAEVLISSYSPNKKITAKEIANTVREILMAQKDYLGGKLPVEKYAFIFYFTEQPVTSYGALEHSYSSFYYMPERTIDEMRQQLRDFAAHEFFHIVTPLTIHSQEIHQFDFNTPAMSKHLWLYEGVTEYFAGNVQVKYGILTPQEYLDEMRQKMVVSTRAYQDNLPFTDLSKYTLEQHGSQYGNVYQKGALIGMCLDIKLRQLSKGKYGMQNLVADLGQKFGKDKAFQDEELFDIIAQITFPEIRDFFKRYVEGPEPLPLKEMLEATGINYIPEREDTRLTLGLSSNFGFRQVEHEGKKRIAIAAARFIDDQGNALGLREGDIVTKLNGEEVPEPGSASVPFFTKHQEALAEGGTLRYEVLRKNEQGAYQRVELASPVVKVKFTNRHLVSFNENATAEQLALRKSWLSAN